MKLKKLLSAALCAVLLLTCSTSAFAAEPLQDTRADGTYTIGVMPDAEGSGRMLSIAAADNNTCKLEVKDGQMVAVVRLNGQGYDKLYLGSLAEAEKATDADCIPYVQDEEGWYTYRIPVQAFDTLLEMQAHSKARNAWYSHNILFYEDYPGQVEPKGKASAEAVALSWKKASGGIAGYEIQYSKEALFETPENTVKVAGGNKVSKTISNLKAGTTYYFRVRTYKAVREKVAYSAWSEAVKATPKIKGTTLKSLTAKTKAAAVKWKEQPKNTKGYEVQYSTSSSFKNAKKVKVAGSSKTSKTVKNLRKGKKYYFRIRAYSVIDGKTVYSAWSAKKSVKVK